MTTNTTPKASATAPKHKLVLPAPAKINLFLHINGQRANGYHDLQTIFIFLDHADTLSFETTDDGQIQLSCDNSELVNDDNLIIGAAKLLQPLRPRLGQGVKIHLDKILPMGGGVGGGSSDAATTMLALNQLWQLGLSTAELAKLGLSLGADIPVFIHGHAVFAEGVGEVFTPYSPPECWYLVAKPDCHVSTAKIFTHPDLPRDTATISPAKYHFDHSRNDCEALVKKLYPEVANTIERLLEYAPTRLTGTGACVFSVFTDRADAEQALAKTKAYLPQNMSIFIAKGLNVSPTLTALNQAMKQE